MAVYDILPSQNLKYEDVRDTLNAGGGSVNNNVSTAFQTSANINKWSRHKPVRSSKLFDLSDNDFKNANFGLSLPNYYPQDFKGAINNATYDYLLPRGGASEPYRLGDFRYYCPTSISPLKKCVDYSFDTTIVGNQFTITLVFNHRGHDDYNIGLDELVSVGDKYLAVILEYDDGRGHTDNLWKTSNTTLGNSGYSVTFEGLNKDSMHNIKYYVCAASRIQEKQTADISSVDFYGLPFNSSSDASAQISIYATNPFSVEFIGTAQDYSSDYYISLDSQLSDGLAFAISASGFWIQSEITAKVSYTLNVSDIRGELKPCSVLGTTTDRYSTTGQVPLELCVYKNGSWQKVSGSYTFSKGGTYKIRVGKADWAYYKDGVKQQYLKSGYIVEDGYIWTYDINTGYGLGGITSCRLGLFS